MRNTTKLSVFRSAMAVACSLAMCVTLAACGGDSGSKDTKKSSSSSSQSSDSSTKMDEMTGVSASGTLGQKPSIKLATTPMTVQNNTYAVLQQGDGAVIKKGDRICAQGVAVNVKDGSELMSSWEKNTPDCSIQLTDANLKQIPPYQKMVGLKVNSTIAFGVNDANSSGTSYVIAYTLVSRSRDLTKATGEVVKDVPADLPKVTRAKNGKPSIDMNGQKAATSLVAQTLVKGTGAETTDKNTVVVKYTGWLTDGTQFDSSWDKNTTIDADLYSGGDHGVITGWQEGLKGQTVGSQVLLIIPPDKGYGSTAQGSIPANSTLVFVVDILAAY
ncbi:FKBP-type peptidyl-prolyl cis-trans isomerase [Bifidobacterium sp. CP2]|uniref:FKBP-type peptidyl-prolyl cis-trans isomerase n=1 Tax=Bifidobacterium TaxID=1678 RepID=UPI001BDBBB5F|nr:MULTISPECIES: FKBP-type peptidyl-prolyl cis-trans isomerase [Bifidobacterium]MBT1181711.1 FKBP-type peptidyl-prolyl cis-trans isomerase [Bifidobacterium sp. CP2]MBW3081284.1 FKBP-type peptidyl-prolyl cis-trans isomerase [Bifidobacterium saguinibicoloris]